MPDYKLPEITRTCMIESLKEAKLNTEKISMIASGAFPLGDAKAHEVSDLYEDIEERLTSIIEVLQEDLEHLP